MLPSTGSGCFLRRAQDASFDGLRMLPLCDPVAVLRVGPGSGVVEGGEALAEGVEGGLGAAAEVQFGEDVADVGAHGGLADGQLVGNLLVAVSLGDEAQDLDLAIGQRAVLWAERRGAGEFPEDLACDGRMEKRGSEARYASLRTMWLNHPGRHRAYSFGSEARMVPLAPKTMKPAKMARYWSARGSL
jgi:hypothetical protein